MASTWWVGAAGRQKASSKCNHELKACAPYYAAWSPPRPFTVCGLRGGLWTGFSSPRAQGPLLVHHRLTTPSLSQPHTLADPALHPHTPPRPQLSYGEPTLFSDTEDGLFHYTWRKALAPSFATEKIRASFPATRWAWAGVLAPFVPGGVQVLAPARGW